MVPILSRGPTFSGIANYVGELVNYRRSFAWHGPCKRRYAEIISLLTVVMDIN